MNGDFSKELFPGLLTIVIPLMMLAAVFVSARRQQQRVRREWEQSRQQDPNLRDWERMEEEIKPSRQWYGLAVLLLVIGWTIGIGSMSYLSTGAGLGIAGGTALVAVLMAALISRKRAAARQLLLNTPAYQQYGNQHLGLAWFIKMFIVASVVGLVSGFLRSEGGVRWIKEKFGRPTTEESRPPAPSSTTIDVRDNYAPILSADFPANIPIYPGATIEAAPASAEARSVTLTTTDSQEQVARYYREELKKRGWRIDDKHSRDDRIDALKGERRCTIRLSAAAGARTRIIIIA